MIAGNVDDFGAFPGLSQNLLNHVIVALFPKPLSFERPIVNHITNKIKLVAFHVLQEVEQEISSCPFGSEMHV